MAKVLVFHYTARGKLPKLNPNEIEDVKKKIEEVLKDYPDVKFNGTYVDEEGMGICDWEAPNADVVKEILKLCTPYGGRFLDLTASTRLSQNNVDC